MKLFELLSRYLSKPRARIRNQRRAQTASLRGPELVLTDHELEPRILLAGASTDKAAEADAPSESDSPTTTYAISEVSGEVVGNVFGTDDWSFLVDQISYDDLSAERKPVQLTIRVVAPGRGSVFTSVVNVVGEATIRNSALDRPLIPSSNDSNLNFALHTVNGQLYLGNLTNQLDLSEGDFGNILKPVEQIAESSLTIDASFNSESRFADNNPVNETSAVTQRPAETVPVRTTDLFFSNSESPLWITDSTGAAVSPDRPSAGDRRGPHRSAVVDIPQNLRRVDRERESEIPQTLRQGETSSHRANWQTGVFTTADSKTSFAQLLNSFVQFDTSELLESDDDVADWLSEQLMLEPIDGGTDSVDASNAASTYADTAEATSGQEENERLQQTFLKLDYASSADTTVSILSEQPPDPPEVVGIRQRLRFDQNPRGPPVSDTLSGSEFTRQCVNPTQLQQLRYSIAPRGPSVASVN